MVARHASHDSHLSSDPVTYTNTIASNAVEIATVNGKPVRGKERRAHTSGFTAASGKRPLPAGRPRPQKTSQP